ncbi:MAG: cytochrome P450, partial [Candidatus Methylomirabilales bacterium]
GMSEREVRDQVMTLFVAGHEPTATALAWTWYLLLKHPGVEQQLQTELATVLGGRVPTSQDLPKLTYTRMVIDEAMRLYPPTWITARTPIQDDEIGGYHIPANSVVLLSPYVTHRHPAFWEEPDVFDPTRFTPGRVAGRSRYAYFPFGGGPRMCMGKGFALTEALLIVAMVAQAYRLHLVPGHPIGPQPMIALRPRHGVLVTLEERPVER